MNQYKNFSQGYALVIAISEYDERNKLPVIVTKDALDIVSILTAEQYCGYDPSKVKVLLNENATLANISNAMLELSEKAGETDTVFIYFSGHGCNLSEDMDEPDCALVPVDFNKDSGGMLRESSISLLLSKIRSERLLFIIDACHSGGTVTFKSNISDNTTFKGFSDKSLANLSRGVGRVLMASSRDSETSLLLRGDQNSLFTKHFLSALKGLAGASSDYICVFDIFSYIEIMVPKEAENAGSQQHPVFKGTLENNFPIALRNGGVVKQTTLGAIESTNSNIKLEDILAGLYPSGPCDQEIWQRAGGDIARLKLSGNGRAQWFSAIRTLQQGGGGIGINILSLITEVKNDFPNNLDLERYFS